MTNADAKSPTRVVQSVERALVALTMLGRSQQSVAQVSQELGLDKSSASRLLATLEEQGFAHRNLLSGAYELGPQIGALGLIYLDRHYPLREVGPILSEIAAATEETVVLSVFDGHRSVFVDKRESQHALRTSARIGNIVPLHGGASGKSVLAYLPARELDALLDSLVLKRFTPHTITNADDLRKELVAIRERGYATSFEEIDQGIGGVGVGLRDWQGSPIGAVSITAPLVRLTDERVRAWAALLRDKLAVWVSGHPIAAQPESPR